MNSPRGIDPRSALEPPRAGDRWEIQAGRRRRRDHRPRVPSPRLPSGRARAVAGRGVDVPDRHRSGVAATDLDRQHAAALLPAGAPLGRGRRRRRDRAAPAVGAVRHALRRRHDLGRHRDLRPPRRPVERPGGRAGADPHLLLAGGTRLFAARPPPRRRLRGVVAGLAPQCARRLARLRRRGDGGAVHPLPRRLRVASHRRARRPVAGARALEGLRRGRRRYGNRW